MHVPLFMRQPVLLCVVMQEDSSDCGYDGTAAQLQLTPVNVFLLWLLPATAGCVNAIRSMQLFHATC